MTREQEVVIESLAHQLVVQWIGENILIGLNQNGNYIRRCLVTTMSKLIEANDAEQRKILDEQVEENRGLRADVLLMQKANAEQREEIRLLSGQVNEANKELLKRAQEITRLREVLKRIENYAGENGCCPYGCDTPYIAKQALTQEPT